MLKETVAWNGLQIVLRRKTWFDNICWVAFHNKLLETNPKDAEKDWYLREIMIAKSVFAQVASQVDKEASTLPYHWPEASASPEALAEAFETFVRLVDDELVSLLADALERLKQPLNERKFAPAQFLSEDERSDPLSDPLASSTVPESGMTSNGGG